MACPFFHPTALLEDDAWLTPPRVPLGDPCTGYCTAGPEASVQPSSSELRLYCNSGYARHHCPRFPAGSDAPDAVRFSITDERDGAIHLVYIFEKDYAPLRHAPLLYHTSTAGFSSEPENASLEAQARKFIESYLNRRVRA